MMEEERWSKKETEALEQLSGEVFGLENLQGRLEKQLEKRGLINQNPIKFNTMKRTFIQLVASLLILVSGYFFGKFSNQTSTNSSDMNTYALFLYENDEFVADDPESLVNEYSHWAEDLASDHKLAYAEKLNDEKDYWLGKASVQNQTSKLTGYFVFYAPDFAAAQKIAETHPHTKYGGGLELRPIDKIDR
jgi:hypothetical protein